MPEDIPPPLKRNYFLILLALAEDQAHGYAIREAVAQRSRGEVDLDPGTLYRLLGRLLDDGLIAESDRRPDPDEDDPRRRYYRLTASGQAALTTEARRMEDLASQARACGVASSESRP